MSKLYDIANAYAELSSSDMDPEFIKDTLEGIEGEFCDKAEQIIKLIKNEQAYESALKAEAAAFSDRAKVSANKIERLKEHLASQMELSGLNSIKAGLHQLTVRAPSKSVEIVDAGLIPANLVEYETTVKPFKLEIKKLLESGQEVPGTKLKTGKPSLLIK